MTDINALMRHVFSDYDTFFKYVKFWNDNKYYELDLVMNLLNYCPGKVTEYFQMSDREDIFLEYLCNCMMYNRNADLLRVVDGNIYSNILRHIFKMNNTNSEYGNFLELTLREIISLKDLKDDKLVEMIKVFFD